MEHQRDASHPFGKIIYKYDIFDIYDICDIYDMR